MYVHSFFAFLQSINNTLIRADNISFIYTKHIFIRIRISNSTFVILLFHRLIKNYKQINVVTPNVSTGLPHYVVKNCFSWQNSVTTTNNYEKHAKWRLIYTLSAIGENGIKVILQLNPFPKRSIRSSIRLENTTHNSRIGILNKSGPRACS